MSTFFAQGFLRLARKLAAGEVVEPGLLEASLLRCNGLNVLGIGATVIGLQASVGEAKWGCTSVQVRRSQVPHQVECQLERTAISTCLATAFQESCTSSLWLNMKARRSTRTCQGAYVSLGLVQVGSAGIYEMNGECTGGRLVVAPRSFSAIGRCDYEGIGQARRVCAW